MAGERQYKSARALQRGLDDYFQSIRRTVEVTENVPTGERDEKGHVIYAPVKVINDKGEVMTRQEYFQPPSGTWVSAGGPGSATARTRAWGR